MFEIGKIINGEITGIQPYGAFVSLDENTQGLIHISEIQTGFTKNIASKIKIGQSVTVKIIDIDPFTNKISLSMRELETTMPMFGNKRKRYFTNYHKKIGFRSLASSLPAWVQEGKNMVQHNE